VQTFTNEAAGAPPWETLARAAQLPPDGVWRVWLLMAGRGAGKTRAGAEWTHARMQAGCKRFALVAPTAADARDVMIEGDSGLLAVADRVGERLLYEPSKRKVTWPNGGMALAFSADEPERLRGPQFEYAWCDEIGSWRYPERAWSNLLFGLRLGVDPRLIATTTPRPTALVRDLVKQPTTILTRGTTYENMANLAPAYRDVVARYEGTRLGRQELMGELLTDTPGALWTYELIERARVKDEDAPEYARVVVAIDPAVSTNEESNETGIIVAGKDHAQHGYVLADRSGRYTPHEWATIALNSFDEFEADAIVIETNQGGDMAVQTIHSVRPGAPVKRVHASRNKITRAEPVSSLYEQNKIHHVGGFPRLEDQLTTYVVGMTSPDRLDALVWAMTDLLVTGKKPIGAFDLGGLIQENEWAAVG